MGWDSVKCRARLIITMDGSPHVRGDGEGKGEVAKGGERWGKGRGNGKGNRGTGEEEGREFEGR